MFLWLACQTMSNCTGSMERRLGQQPKKGDRPIEGALNRPNPDKENPLKEPFLCPGVGELSSLSIPCMNWSTTWLVSPMQGTHPQVEESASFLSISWWNYLYRDSRPGWIELDWCWLGGNHISNTTISWKEYIHKYSLSFSCCYSSLRCATFISQNYFVIPLNSPFFFNTQVVKPLNLADTSAFYPRQIHTLKSLTYPKVQHVLLYSHEQRTFRRFCGTWRYCQMLLWWATPVAYKSHRQKSRAVCDEIWKFGTATK